MWRWNRISKHHKDVTDFLLWGRVRMDARKVRMIWPDALSPPRSRTSAHPLVGLPEAWLPLVSVRTGL